MQKTLQAISHQPSNTTILIILQTFQKMEETRRQIINDNWLCFRTQNVEQIIFRFVQPVRKPPQIQVKLIKMKQKWWKGQSLSESYTKLLQIGFKSSYKYTFLKSVYQELPSQYNQNSQDLRQYFRSEMTEFNFEDPKNVLFLGKPQSWIELISYKEINPLLSLRLAQSAYLIIRHIIKGQYANMPQKISKWWDLSSNPISILDTKLKEATLEAVARLKGMFSVMDSKGYAFSLDRQIYNQNRFMEGASRSRAFIFHPTSTTKQIFSQTQIRKVQKAQDSNQNIYIYGQSGIGKSISFSLLVELHNIIMDFRLRLPPKVVLCQIDSKFEWQQFQKLPKYFYFNFGPISFSYSIFLRAISLQLSSFVIQDCKNEDDTLNIDKVVNWYKRRKIEVVFIIDQINVYFSLVRRKKQNNLKDQNNNYQKLINDISNLLYGLSKHKIVYLASENAQISMVSRQQNYSFQEFKLVLKKIKFEAMSQKKQGIRETFSTVLFQLQNQIMNKQQQDQKAINLIKEKIRQFEIIQKSDVFPRLQQYLSTMTHQRVKLFFKYNPLKVKYRLNDQDTVQALFQQIHNFIIQEYCQKYRRFVFQKGDKETKKQKFINVIKMRQAAEQLFQQLAKSNTVQLYFDFKFPYSMRDKQYQQLFKEHTQFVDENFVRIYFSPKIFLQITQFINEQVGFYASIFKQVIDMCGVNPNRIGTTFDVVHATIFCQYNIKLILSKEYNLFNAKNECKNRKFQHFLNMISSNQRQKPNLFLTKQKCKITIKTSIYIRFFKLFKLLASKEVKDFQDVCAAPRIRMPKFHFSSSDSSSNSQCIDFLIIKCLDERKFGQNNQPLSNDDQEDHYELETFDFCVSYTKSYIDNKIDRSVMFFKKFMWIAELQNTKDGQYLVNKLLKQRNYGASKERRYKFETLTHWILMPKQMMKGRKIIKNIDPTFQIKFYPLEEIRFNFLNSYEETNNIKCLSKSLIEKIKDKR